MAGAVTAPFEITRQVPDGWIYPYYSRLLCWNDYLSRTKPLNENIVLFNRGLMDNFFWQILRLRRIRIHFSTCLCSAACLCSDTLRTKTCCYCQGASCCLRFMTVANTKTELFWDLFKRSHNRPIVHKLLLHCNCTQCLDKNQIRAWTQTL